MSKEMTSRQSWAIFCISGYDVRNTKIKSEDASKIIGNLKSDDPHKNAEAIVSIEDCGGTKKKDASGSSNKDQDYRAIYEEACEAGHKAATNHKPTPMHVVQRANPLDDSSEIVHRYEPVSDGVCGFAWINLKPATHSFAKWLKKNDLGRKDSYYGGRTIWVFDYNQSMEKKSAYAQAFASVINKHFADNKFQAFPMSRMD